MLKQVTGIKWMNVGEFRSVLWAYLMWIAFFLALNKFIPSFGLVVVWSVCSAIVLFLAIKDIKEGWTSKLNYYMWALLGVILGPWMILVMLTMNLADVRAMRAMQRHAKEEYLDVLEQTGHVDEFSYEELTHDQSQQLVFPDEDPEWQ